MSADGARKLLNEIPGVAMLRGYRPARLGGDLAAGVAVGAMLVPQGLAFAELAGMRPAAGLWAAMVSLVAYAIFGPSRQLMVGPEAGTAILTLAVISPLGLEGAQYESAAGALAVLVGLLLLIGGLARAGAIADFLSRPILVGYLNGIAWVLIASQLGVLIGLRRQESDFIPQLVEVARGLDRIHEPTLWLSLATIALLVLLWRFAPKIPGAVVVIVVTLPLSAWLGFEGKGIAVVGEIDRGFPAPALPSVDFRTLVRLIPGAFGAALLAYASAVLTSRSFADKRSYSTSANKEFFGLSTANFLSAVFQGFPVAASESRTVVNDSAGGRTQMVSLAASVVVLSVLLFLTPVFAYLPTAMLGAVVIVAAISLIDVEGIVRLWRVRSWEGALSLMTMAAVLVFGILEGILIAVALSLGALIRRATLPHDAVLGRLKGRPGYQDVENRPGSETLPGLVIYRVDAPLFFANARFVKEQVCELTANEDVRMLVLDAGGIFDMDMTAAEMLEKLHAELSEAGTTLAIAEPHAPLRRALRKSGLLDKVGEENVFPTVGAAIRAYVDRTEDIGLDIDWKRVDDGHDPPP